MITVRVPIIKIQALHRRLTLSREERKVFDFMDKLENKLEPSPVPVPVVAGVSPVPVQMWRGWAQSRCRCGRGDARCAICSSAP